MKPRRCECRGDCGRHRARCAYREGGTAFLHSGQPADVKLAQLGDRELLLCAPCRARLGAALVAPKAKASALGELSLEVPRRAPPATRTFLPYRDD